MAALDSDAQNRPLSRAMADAITNQPFFRREADSFLPNPIANGPWDPNSLHGRVADMHFLLPESKINPERARQQPLARHRVEDLDLVLFDANHKLVPANRWQVFEERTFRNRRSDLPEPREAVVADVTGDGKNDLIVLVHDRILVYPQE